MSGGRWDTNKAPKPDSAGNGTINDVIGNKDDTHNGNSLYSKAETVDDHFHKKSEVYPTLDDPINVATSVLAWTFGAFTEIIPASTVPHDFDIHFISFENINDSGIFEIALYAVTTIIGSVRFTRNTFFNPTLNLSIQTPIVPGGTQIQARLASDTLLVDSVDISLFYHEY